MSSKNSAVARLEAALSGLAGAPVKLERPSKADFGDYATNVALQLAVSVVDDACRSVDPFDGRLEVQRQPAREAGRDQILHDLGLAVDHDPAADELLHRYVVPLAVELQMDASVRHSLRVHSRADAGLSQQVGDALLEHARSNPVLAVLTAAGFEDDRVDPAQLEQSRQRQPRGAGADDPDLGLHRSNSAACPWPTPTQSVATP